MIYGQTDSASEAHIVQLEIRQALEILWSGVMRNIQREKSILVQQMRSKVNSEAVQAINILRENRDNEYRKNASLLSGSDLDKVSRSLDAQEWTNFRNENLSGANLQGADLSGINMRFENSNLTGANLQDTKMVDTVFDNALLYSANLRNANMKQIHLLGAGLQHADFRNASLEGGHLHGADFSFAKFQGADLYGAKMTEANLLEANLQGAEIIWANFKSANLENANFAGVIWFKDEYGRKEYNVTLPDGSLMKSENELERFTNPNNESFWRPKYPVAWGDNQQVPGRSDLSDLDLRKNDNY